MDELNISSNLSLRYDLTALDDLYRPGVFFLTFKAIGPEGREVSFTTTGIGKGYYVRDDKGAYTLVDSDFRLPGTTTKIKRILKNLYLYDEPDTPVEIKARGGAATFTQDEVGYLKCYSVNLESDPYGVPKIEPDWDDEPFQGAYTS